MKKLVNKDDPRCVLVVNYAYVNGRRILCDAGKDNFDLWAEDWRIENYPAAEVEIVEAAPQVFHVSLGCTKELMDYMAKDKDTRLAVYEQLRRTLDAEVLRVSRGEGGQNLSER